MSNPPVNRGAATDVACRLRGNELKRRCPPPARLPLAELDCHRGALGRGTASDKFKAAEQLRARQRYVQLPQQQPVPVGAAADDAAACVDGAGA
eukprot:209877-Chlamydomonas_euryale.AAC.1